MWPCDDQNDVTKTTKNVLKTDVTPAILSRDFVAQLYRMSHTAQNKFNAPSVKKPQGHGDKTIVCDNDSKRAQRVTECKLWQILSTNHVDNNYYLIDIDQNWTIIRRKSSNTSWKIDVLRITVQFRSSSMVLLGPAKRLHLLKRQKLPSSVHRKTPEF